MNEESELEGLTLEKYISHRHCKVYWQSSRVIGKFFCEELSAVKISAESGHEKQTMLLEDVNAFFKFVIIKVIIFDKEVMHVQ